MDLEQIIFTPEQENILRKYRNSDAFIEMAREKILSSTIIYSTDTASTKNVILKWPQFVGYDHKRVLEGLIEVYGIENQEKIKNAILKFPQFTGYDHKRVLEGLIEVYGIENQKKIKNAIFKFPQFTGLDHKRVLRQKIKLGRLLELNDNDIREIFLKYPTSTGCSYKRDLAIFDVVRELNKESLEVTLKQVLNNLTKSPYVPDTKRDRISKARRKESLIEMPPMYETLKKIALKNN